MSDINKYSPEFLLELQRKLNKKIYIKKIYTILPEKNLYNIDKNFELDEGYIYFSKLMKIKYKIHNIQEICLLYIYIYNNIIKTKYYYDHGIILDGIFAYLYLCKLIISFYYKNILTINNILYIITKYFNYKYFKFYFIKELLFYFTNIDDDYKFRILLFFLYLKQYFIGLTATQYKQDFISYYICTTESEIRSYDFKKTYEDEYNIEIQKLYKCKYYLQNFYKINRNMFELRYSFLNCVYRAIIYTSRKVGSIVSPSGSIVASIVSSIVAPTVGASIVGFTSVSDKSFSSIASVASR